jgi:hypothetical protein
VSPPEPREYLNAEQLAAVTPWSRKAIERLVARGVLVRGVHYFQPQGPRTPLIFKWSEIVLFIEGGGGARLPAAATGGRLDVEATTAALERLLVSKPCGPTPASVPYPRPARPSRARRGFLTRRGIAGGSNVSGCSSAP